jgi:hypothetical protein
MTPSCPTRRVLAERFATAARLYAESAVKLVSFEESRINYARLRNYAIRAQERSEAAFRAFTEHVASHQCGQVRPSETVNRRRRGAASGR